MNLTARPGGTMFRFPTNTRSVANPPARIVKPPAREPGPDGTREERQEWMRRKQLEKRRKKQRVAEP
jgi:hypothetical protein